MHSVRTIEILHCNVHIYMVDRNMKMIAVICCKGHGNMCTCYYHIGWRLCQFSRVETPWCWEITYRTIMIGYYLAKLYGSIKVRIEYAGRAKWLPFSWTGTLFKCVHNFGSHIHHPGPNEEGWGHNKRIHCCFMDFQKAFDTVPCARLMQQLEALGVPTDM